MLAERKTKLVPASSFCELVAIRILIRIPARSLDTMMIGVDTTDALSASG